MNEQQPPIIYFNFMEDNGITYYSARMLGLDENNQGAMYCIFDTAGFDMYGNILQANQWYKIPLGTGTYVAEEVANTDIPNWNLDINNVLNQNAFNLLFAEATTSQTLEQKFNEVEDKIPTKSYQHNIKVRASDNYGNIFVYANNDNNTPINTRALLYSYLNDKGFNSNTKYEKASGVWAISGGYLLICGIYKGANNNEFYLVGNKLSDASFQDIQVSSVVVFSTITDDNIIEI